MKREFSSFIWLLALPLIPFAVKAVLAPKTQQVQKIISPISFGGLRSVALKAAQSQPTDKLSAIRLELLASLDLLVRAERTIQNETGGFTRAVGRVPDVLGAVTQFYKIDIAKATRKNLLVVANGDMLRTLGSEYSPIVGDRVAIDERFNVRSNFPVPQPPREYLHVIAKTVMNRIYSNQFLIPEQDTLNEWEGIFRGNFRYEIRPVSQGGRTIVAVGLQAPVKGDLVEMEVGVDLFAYVFSRRHTDWADLEFKGQLERFFWAQKISRDHTGQYTPTFIGVVSHWNGLAAFTSEDYPLALRDYQLDPTFGFHAEVGLRAPAQLGSGNPRAPSQVKGWAVNGYGQISEISTIERLMDQVEQVHRSVVSPETLRNDEMLRDVEEAPTKKRLLIDAVDGDR